MLSRRNIARIKPYTPGKPIEEVQRQLGLRKVYKMASNENAFGPSPKAVSSIKKGLKDINRYPDASCFYLKEKLAKKLKVKTKNLMVGNGSDELIVLALKAFLNEGEEVITADTTFLIYSIASQVANARLKIVPMRKFKYDLKAIKRSISRKTKIVFIANPDNPTGTYITDKEIALFMKAIPKSTIVFFDEAYYEFGRQEKYFPNTMKYLDRKNVIITRTFSKVYGLSGLRVGYGMADSSLVSAIDKVREPFNVNLLAQKAACAALDDTAFLKSTIAATKKGKEYLYREFDAMGLEYVPSATNFILADCNKNSTIIFKKLLKSGIIVRDMKAWGLGTYIRVTVGTGRENRKFIKALRGIV